MRPWFYLSKILYAPEALSVTNCVIPGGNTFNCDLHLQLMGMLNETNLIFYTQQKIKLPINPLK